MFSYQLHHPQPERTQRSIIDAARELLKGISTELDTVLVLVERPFNVFTAGQALDGPQQWHGPGYVVTFERRPGGPWQAVSVN